MNLRKAILLITLCTVTFPANGSAKTIPTVHVEPAARHSLFSSFFIHLVNFGRRTQ
jgi:hypothetical protein